MAEIGNCNSKSLLYPSLSGCFYYLCTQGLHPRIIAEGFEAAKDKALQMLEEVKVTKEMDRETLINVARTSLRTKVHTELADLLTEVRLRAGKCLGGCALVIILLLYVYVHCTLLF